MSGSQTKVEKTEFFIVFSKFDRDLKQLCNGSDDMVIPGKFHAKKLYE